MLQAMFSRVRQGDREGGEGEVLWCVEKTGHVWLGFYVGPIGPHTTTSWDIHQHSSVLQRRSEDKFD